MTVATALISGNDAVPLLAEQAVHAALKRTGNHHANSVMLLLSSEFARHPQSAVLAAARAAQCTQVFGAICAGVITEAGWVLDQPAAAAMVFCGKVALATSESATPAIDAPLLCCTSSPFPGEWMDGRHFGSHFHGNAGNGADSLVWQQGRLVAAGAATAQVVGARMHLAVSTGLRGIGTPLPVDEVRGYDLLSLGGQPALDTLLRLLPADWQARTPLPIHLINAMLATPDARGATEAAAIISVNADRSLTLTAPLQPGQMMNWAIRQPSATEAEMREALESLDSPAPIQPDFGMVFSCIGRGPYFYGGEDRDLAVLAERFPDMPLIGAYGSGQIAFTGQRSRQLQNSVVTALFNEASDV